MDAVMTPLECRSNPVAYEKESALFVQYCWVEQKCKINSIGRGESTCRLKTYLMCLSEVIGSMMVK